MAVVGWWAEAFVSVTGISGASAFGTATVIPGAASIAPTGVTSAEAFGTTLVQNVHQFITPTDVASAEAFGTAELQHVLLQSLSPSSITTTETFGTAKLNHSITATGIGTTETFGSTTVTKPVAFDSVSNQAPGVATSWSYSHTATAGAYVVLCLVADRAVTLSNVHYDGNSMTLLGSQKLNNGSTSELFMYGISGVAGGSKTVSGTITSSFFTVNTIGFLNVVSVGSVSNAYGNGTSLSQGSISCPSGNMIVQAFGTGSSATTYTSLSGGTNKVNTAANGSTMAINIATANTTFTATGASQPWAGLAAVLST